MCGCASCFYSLLAFQLSEIVVMLLQHGVQRNPESEGTFGIGAREEPHRFYSPQHSQATLLCTASPGPATYK